MVVCSWLIYRTLLLGLYDRCGAVCSWLIYRALLLGLYDRCGAVFEHLATASIELDDTRHAPSSMLSGGRAKMVRLHAAHALSMDMLLSMAVEMGSHTDTCWKHIFRFTFHTSDTRQFFIRSFVCPFI